MVIGQSSMNYQRTIQSFYEQIKESKQYFRTFVDHIQDGLFVISAKAIILEVNHAACEMLEYSREELLLRPITSLCPQQNIGRANYNLAKLREEGYFFQEITLVTKQGNHITAELNASLMPDGTCIGTVRDITLRKKMEEKLIESEDRYRKLVDLSPDAIVVHCQGKVQYINQAGARIAGVNQPEEIIGKNLMDFVHADFKKVVQNRIRSAFKLNRTLPLLEEKLVLPDRSVVHGEVAAVPFVFNGNQSMLVVIRNTTERRKTEQLLVQQQKDLQDQLGYANALNRLAELVIATEDIPLIFGAMTNIIGQALAFDHCIVYSIDYLLNTIEQVSQYKNNDVAEILLPDHKDLIDLKKEEECFFTERKLFESHSDDQNGYLYHSMIKKLHHDFNLKSLFWYPFAFTRKGFFGLAFDQVSFKRILKETEREFINSCLKLVEIAIQKIHYSKEHRQVVERLRKAEREKELILSAISDLVVFYDCDFTIKWANLATEESKGIPLDQLIGSHCYEIWQERTTPCIGCPVMQTLATGDKHKNEMSTPDGKLWSVKSFPVIDHDGTIIGAVEIARDITEKKKIEQEMARLERLNLIGEMAASFGHEIRNPMATVRGFLQMLHGKTECMPLRDYFDLMIEEMDRANSIITEFLSMAKHKPVDLKKDNLINIINSLFPLILADAMHADKSIELELQDIPNVWIDKKETNQLILNLVRNGLESMPRGGCLTIKTYAEEEEVILAIQDQGSGIQPEIMNKLGMPFVTTKENGTGLGLAICYSIIERHQAKMDVHSGPEGTTFFIRYKKAV